MIQDPSKYGSVFEMSVLGDTKAGFNMPENFTIGVQGYTCGDVVPVAPSKYSLDGRRWTKALGTWNVTCMYSQFLASTTPKCCVLSAFYNSTIVPCPKCSCSYPGLPEKNTTTKPYSHTMGRILFNGYECVMPPPDQYPRLPNIGHRDATLSIVAVFFCLLLGETNGRGVAEKQVRTVYLTSNDGGIDNERTNQLGFGRKEDRTPTVFLYNERRGALTIDHQGFSRGGLTLTLVLAVTITFQQRREAVDDRWR
ncbi:hypothetical protein F3Y22_tig00110343pilonHSYRG00041 [Hibiscus syriacus]|uniref:Uncharacterized protein n=1 Tax=Hibiscus syriacus TaxID=106335 RepID=A0A6A3AX22_HIBSY|nr:hypothetical protein F3Y22_tig00110343pilonHSYRG00041 [Hibiscus syriacus]